MTRALGVPLRHVIGRGAAPRRRCRRALARAAALAALVALAVAAPAEAGTFRVSQCRAAADGGLAPRAFQASLWSVDRGWATVDCGPAGGAVRIGIGSWRLLADDSTVAHVTLPASMPRTSARAAWIDWHSNPPSASTNPAFTIFAVNGVRLFETTAGQGTAPGAAMRLGLPAGSRSLSFRIYCSTAYGPGWCSWPGSQLDIHGLTLELEESGDPSATADGALVAGGERAGVVPVAIAAADGDSGVRRVSVSLGGVAVGTLEPAEPCTDDRLPPCPQSLRGTLDVDTRLVPDGERRLRLVVADAAGNTQTYDAGTVRVANIPVVPPGPVPESESGTGSGAGTGSGGGSPGGAPGGGSRTSFPPNPLAGRGHAPNGRHASERARLRAWLELGRTRSGSTRRRRSVSVPYGERVRIRGRLTDEHGRGIGRATLATIRREPGRPWRAVTGVRTRPDGRFTAFSRIGPSQELRFVYYAFGDSARGRPSPRLRVRVVR
jgi:hypothetical protein